MSLLHTPIEQLSAFQYQLALGSKDISTLIYEEEKKQEERSAPKH